MSLCGERLDRRPGLQARYVQQQDRKYHQRSVKSVKRAYISLTFPNVIDDRTAFLTYGPPLGPQNEQQRRHPRLSTKKNGFNGSFLVKDSRTRDVAEPSPDQLATAQP